MKPCLTIRLDSTTNTYQVSVEGAGGVLATAEARLDAQRIARGIAAWTQLDVLDFT